MNYICTWFAPKKCFRYVAFFDTLFTKFVTNCTFWRCSSNILKKTYDAEFAPNIIKICTKHNENFSYCIKLTQIRCHKGAGTKIQMFSLDINNKILINMYKNYIRKKRIERKNQARRQILSVDLEQLFW